MSASFALTSETVRKAAKLSPCGTYRYNLERTWGTEPPLVCVLCNPSTADAEEDDPTIRVLSGMARRRGYGGILVVNVFALRSTDPAALRGHADPDGPEGDYWLSQAFDRACGGPVLCAWGNIGAGKRATSILGEIRNHGAHPVAIKLSKEGNPVHPLRQKTGEPLVELLHQPAEIRDRPAGAGEE